MFALRVHLLVFGVALATSMSFASASRRMRSTTRGVPVNRPTRPTLHEWQEAKRNASSKEAAAAAKEKKKAAIYKVIEMLEDLQAEVINEGEIEAKTYDKFACWCNDTTVEKTNAINRGQDRKSVLSAKIGTLEARRLDLDDKIKTFLADIDEAESAMKVADATRSKEIQVYQANAADCQGALDGLEGALASLKASKLPSFVQLQAAANQVKPAILLAEAMGIHEATTAATATASFLQQQPYGPSAPVEQRSGGGPQAYGEPSGETPIPLRPSSPAYGEPSGETPIPLRPSSPPYGDRPSPPYGDRPGPGEPNVGHRPPSTPPSYGEPIVDNRPPSGPYQPEPMVNHRPPSTPPSYGEPIVDNRPPSGPYQPEPMVNHRPPSTPPSYGEPMVVNRPPSGPYQPMNEPEVGNRPPSPPPYGGNIEQRPPSGPYQPVVYGGSVDARPPSGPGGYGDRPSTPPYGASVDARPPSGPYQPVVNRPGSGYGDRPSPPPYGGTIEERPPSGPYQPAVNRPGSGYGDPPSPPPYGASGPPPPGYGGSGDESRVGDRTTEDEEPLVPSVEYKFPPDVPTEDYKYHSDCIIKELEKLLASFRVTKSDIDREEVRSAAAHDMFMQEKARFVKHKTLELEEARKQKEKTHEEIAACNKEFSTVAATLLEDKEYMRVLARMCSEKAITYDQRLRVRTEELSTLVEVIGIVKEQVNPQVTANTIRFVQRDVNLQVARAVAGNDAAMEAVEASVEAATASDRAPFAFVQSSKDPTPATEGGRRSAVELLRRRGKDLHSALLTSLAERVSDDPFVKVKQLIQELIERLMREAGHEATHKGWCDTSTSDAEQKRDYAAGQILELNGEMAQLQGQLEALVQELAALSSEIERLQLSRAEAQQLRDEETKENAATVSEAHEGEVALDTVIEILTKFYKTKAKETIVFSLTQRGPYEDAPETSFETGDANQGAQAEMVGILGMLEVIKSDFARTIAETQAAEAEAVQAHLQFMTETGKSLAEATTAKKQTEDEHSRVEENFDQADESLQAQTETLQTSLQELLELKPACVDIGMSYQERVSRRDDEIAALTKALCILEANDGSTC